MVCRYWEAVWRAIALTLIAFGGLALIYWVVYLPTTVQNVEMPAAHLHPRIINWDDPRGCLWVLWLATTPIGNITLLECDMPPIPDDMTVYYNPNDLTELSAEPAPPLDPSIRKQAVAAMALMLASAVALLVIGWLPLVTLICRGRAQVLPLPPPLPLTRLPSVTVQTALEENGT